MSKFNYEWWTVDITDTAGRITWKFKGKNKDNVIRQINKAVSESHSKENAERDCWHRMPRIIEVHWDTLKLDRVGYQRLS